MQIFEESKNCGTQNCVFVLNGCVRLPNCSKDDLVVNIRAAARSTVCLLRAVTEPGDIIAIESPQLFCIGSIAKAIKAPNLHKRWKSLHHPERASQLLEALEEKLALDQWPIKAIFVTPNL